MKLNEKIKKLRIDNNLTQQELADKLFVSRSAVAKWEQGRGTPSLELLDKISEIFDVKIEDLLSEKETQVQTIENSVQLKKQHKVNLVIVLTIIAMLVFCTFAIPNIVVWVLRNESHTTPTGPYTQELTHSGKVMFFEDSMLVHRPNMPSTAKYFNLDEIKTATVYNREGEIVDFSVIEDDYRVKVYYTRHRVYGETDYNEEFTRIDIVDDYNENTIEPTGFFFSTTPYEGDSPPNMIYEYPHSYTKSPYEWQYQFTLRMNDQSNGIVGTEKGSTVNGNRREEYLYEIQAQSPDSIIYVYALDEKYEKGYVLCGEITSTNYKLELPSYLDFKETNKYDSTKAYSVKQKVTVVCYYPATAYTGLTITEYDENNVVAEKTFSNMEELDLLNGRYFVNDLTKYVQITYAGKTYEYGVGTSAKVKLHNQAGFVFDYTIKIY